MINNRTLPDTHQNFWELASIQVASMGLPGMIIGWQIANDYGTGNAIGAICIGNLILWLVGLVIISMSAQYRTDAITNVRQHMGKPSAYLTAIILMLAFLFWYSIQIKSLVNALDSIFQIHHYAINSRSVRIGAAIGLWASLLAIGGIRMIKWINVVCLPIFIGGQIYLIASDHSQGFEDLWGISFSAIIIIVLYNILVTTIIPTFFRHSRSLADSFLALTIIAVLNSFFQISGIWIGYNELLPIIQNYHVTLLFLVTTFLVLLVICNLLVNIYFAAASWEATLPFEGPKEYAIIGLAGTAAYIFIQITPPMIFLRDLVTDFISNLSIVLLITFLVQIVVKRRPIKFGKLVGSASWLIGCITVAILNFTSAGSNADHLFTAIGASALFFLFIIFFEETIWSVKKLIGKDKSNSSLNELDKD